jgi:hypothetical protein
LDFYLTANAMAAIDARDTGERGGPDPDIVHAQFFADTGATNADR